MPDIWVQSFTHIKGLPRSETALEMLKKTASLVKPIMRKHGWVLPVLAEFFPDSPSLLGLNVNMGAKILIRLRYAGSPDAFLPEEDVVGTMLHELTHNVHGPHDDQFYKFLSGLQEEYDDLRRSKYAGEGFFSAGRRLGENISHNVPRHVARQKALEAAEKRRNNSRILGGTGQRLGGGGGGLGRNAGLTPRQMAARAAEQRLRDEKTCGSGVLAQQEAEKAAKVSIESKVIDLTANDDEMSVDVDVPDSGSVSDAIILEEEEEEEAGTSGKMTKVTTKSPTNIIVSPPARTAESSSTRGWACMRCTFVNPATAPRCDICDLPRSTGHSVMDQKPSSKLPEGWACPTCTLVNPHFRWNCEACESIKLQT